METSTRFFKKTRRQGDCLLWTAAQDKSGYGQFWDGTAKTGSHRVRWTMEHGKIPDGLFVLHTCDTPACVEIDHLWLGTAGENNTDRNEKGRDRKPGQATHCINGHEYDEGNTYIYPAGSPQAGVVKCKTCRRENA